MNVEQIQKIIETELEVANVTVKRIRTYFPPENYRESLAYWEGIANANEKLLKQIKLVDPLLIGS